MIEHEFVVSIHPWHTPPHHYFVLLKRPEVHFSELFGRGAWSRAIPGARIARDGMK
jgi:hypothetical protein